MGMRETFETVAYYPTTVAAELAAAFLRDEGIDARLRDHNATSILPHLASAMGEVKVDVPAEEAERARALLREIESTETDDISDDPRCPACESTYLKEVRRAMVCQRCGHRFAPEDAAEPVHGSNERGYRGRAARPAAGNDVYRLRRNSKGTGLVIGLLLGLGLGLAIGRGEAELALIVVALTAVGWMAGRSWEFDVCSLPSCRARLHTTLRRCPGCNGVIRGNITSPGDHWALRAADRRARDRGDERSDEEEG